MHQSRGFTMVEMVISVTLFAAGAVYIASTFAGVTASSQTVTTEIDLSSQNKRALSQVFNELQATSLTPQDTDGVDSTDPVGVFAIEGDPSAPVPHTLWKLVTRATSTVTQTGEAWNLGKSQTQARERAISSSQLLRFRKVIGYQFNAAKGTIVPEWSNEVTYRVNNRRQLVRSVAGGPTRVIAQHVDALDAQVTVDGTVILTIITARPLGDGKGWKRYANSVTVRPKN